MNKDKWIIITLWILVLAYVILAMRAIFFPLGLILLVAHIVFTKIYTKKRSNKYLAIIAVIFVLFLTIQFFNFPECTHKAKPENVRFRCDCLGITKSGTIIGNVDRGISQCVGIRTQCYISVPCNSENMESCTFLDIECKNLMEEYYKYP